MFVFWPDFLFVCPCRRTAPATARARTTSSSSRRETTWAWPSSPCSAASGPWESRRSTSRRGWGRMHTHTHSITAERCSRRFVEIYHIFMNSPTYEGTHTHTHTHTPKKNMHIHSSGDSSPECWGLSRIKIKKDWQLTPLLPTQGHFLQSQPSITQGQFVMAAWCSVNRLKASFGGEHINHFFQGTICKR